MAICTVEPGPLAGRLLVPPSKSMGHRALFCAALADGESHIDNVVLSDDMLATLAALKSLGVRTSVQESRRYAGRSLVTVFGTGSFQPTGEAIDCHESGSTARFVIPVTRLVSDPVSVTGRGRLMERPFGLFRTIFAGKGVQMTDRDGCLPASFEGRLESGTFRLRGDVSSQFITGLLFILPKLQGDSVIEVEGTLESAPYVSMTLEMLEMFGVKAEMNVIAATEASGNVTSRDVSSVNEITGDVISGNVTSVNDSSSEIRTGACIHVPGGQSYRPTDYEVEGDWSQAAFWIVAGALGNPLVLEGLRMNSLQGDRVVVDLMRGMGAEIREEEACLRVGFSQSPLKALDMDVAQCPDLVPALAVAAAFAEGRSRIGNAARLRIKESDRLKAMREQLGALGASIVEEPDGLLIEGSGMRVGGFPTGGEVDGCGDHRIVMASAIAATNASGPVIIHGMESVRKSYPGFWDDFRVLGGIAHEQHLG